MTAALRVLAALPTPPPYSGPEAVAALLLETGLGPDIELCHVRTNVHHSNADKGRVTPASLTRLAVALLKTVATIVQRRPQLLFIYLSQNQTGFLRDALFIAVARCARMGVVVQVHGANFANFRRAASWPLRRLIALAFRWIDDVVVLADRFRPQFDGLVASDHVWVVPNAVRENLAAVRQRDEAGCVFLFMGHLSPAKGFVDLVRAAPRVLEELPQARFEFAGEWLSEERNIHLDQWERPMASSDGRASSAALASTYGSRARFLGVVSGAAKADALGRAQVFVLPSYSEGFPMAVLDAMAAGLPLVVTPVGALPELLTSDHAVFVEPGDVDGLAAALIRVGQDRARRQVMGAANRALVNECFTPERAAESLARCVRASAARRRHA